MCSYAAVTLLVLICTFQLAGVYPEFGFFLFYWLLRTGLNRTFPPSMATSSMSFEFSKVPLCL